jgi:hypothetical protein
MKREELIQKTIEVFCEENEIPKEMLPSKQRNRRLVDCRRMIWAYLRENTSMTLIELADIVGFENHATVLYHCKQHEDLVSKTERGRWMYPNYGPYYERGATQLSLLSKMYKLNQKFQNYRLRYVNVETGEKQEFTVNSSSLLEAIHQHEAIKSMIGFDLVSVKAKDE